MFDNVHKIQASFKGTDITNFITQISLYADVLSPYLSATVTVVDTSDFLQFFIGDVIEFKLQSPNRLHLSSVSHPLKLSVASVPSSDLKKPGMKSYQISLVSPIALLDKSFQESLLFSNEDPERAIDLALSKLNVDCRFVSVPSSTITMSCNNMTPMQSAFSIMKYMTAGDRADFLMFPNFFNDKELIVKSVSDIFSDATPITLARKLATSQSADSIEERIFNVSRAVSVPFNAAAFSVLNANSRETKVIDLMNKTTAVFKASENSDKFSDALPLKKATDYVYSRLQEGEATVFNEIGKLQPARLKALLNFERDKLIVQLPAHIDWFSKLSKTVSFLLPSHDSTNHYANNPLSDRYAVSAIAMSYQPERDVVMNLELVRAGGSARAN